MIIVIAHLGHISLKTINFSQREDNIGDLTVRTGLFKSALLKTPLKANLFLTRERMMELENLHFATITEKLIQDRIISGC